MTKLRIYIVEKFTIVLAKEISCINDFILKIKETMKLTSPNSHVDCMIDSNYVLLPRILEICENHSMRIVYFIEKALTYEIAQNDKKAQENIWKKGQRP